MWSFYTLAVMFSLTFIQSIVLFGCTKTTGVSGGAKGLGFIVIMLIAYIFWDFLEPMKHQVGMLLFALVVSRAFINFVRDLGKPAVTIKYGYWNFFNSFIYVVAIIGYQVIVK